MSKRPKKRPGRSATADERREMSALGYATIADVAIDRRVAPTTVYGWAETWDQQDLVVKGKPAVIKSKKGVWVLVAAARELHPTAKELARRAAA